MNVEFDIEFWVLLIKTRPDQTKLATKSLKENCTHVINNYWIFEGDPEVLEWDSVNFEIVEEGAVPCLGDMNQQELIRLCKEVFGINVLR